MSIRASGSIAEGGGPAKSAMSTTGKAKQQQGGKQPAAVITETTVNSVASQVYRLALFDHLSRKQTVKDPDSIEGDRILHFVTIQLGLQYNRGQIQNDDDRAQALMAAIICIITDYKTPPLKNMREDLDRYLSKQVQHLVESRQISKGMGNVIKYVRQCISKVSPELSEAEAKSIILGDLQRYLEEKMIYAGESIAQFVASTVNDGDVILTFGSSPLLRKVLLHCVKLRKFRLIVVDSRPLNEGLQTVAALSNVVPCVYTPLSGAAYALKDVSKVILGASCLLSNGSMLAVAGTAMVAALAKARQIPVVVASESYKFSDKVQLDSIVFNELGHSSEIVVPCPPGYESEEHDGMLFIPQFEPGYRGSSDKLLTSDNQSGVGDDQTDLITVPAQQKGLPKVVSKMPFEVFNLRYDLTPLANISVIATETGLIPPTSVPVLIREIQGEVGGR